MWIDSHGAQASVQRAEAGVVSDKGRTGQGKSRRQERGEDQPGKETSKVSKTGSEDYSHYRSQRTGELYLEAGEQVQQMI